MHICNSPRVNIMRESYNQSDELPTKEKNKAKCTEEKNNNKIQFERCTVTVFLK